MSMKKNKPLLQILLPVYNEAESIERVLREIYNEFSPRVRMQFIVSEDGSTDGTKRVLKELAKKIPMILISDEKRKGYSRAVIDGMKRFTGDYLLCLDSDGQCDPKDFWQFWKNRNTADLLIGHRLIRRDPPIRLILSRGFYYLYKSLFPVKSSDPSCPFLLTTPGVVRRLLSELGTTDQGFWWEFVARTYRRHFSIKQFPVSHRPRFAGQTQVYKFKKMPVIGYRHVTALFKIWWETRD